MRRRPRPRRPPGSAGPRRPGSPGTSGSTASARPCTPRPRRGAVAPRQALLVEAEDLQLDRQVDLAQRHVRRTVMTAGAKLRIEVTPASTSRSATSWATWPGMAMMPMAIGSPLATAGRSSMWRTARPSISSPTLAGSASNSADDPKASGREAPVVGQRVAEVAEPTMATGQSWVRPSSRLIWYRRYSTS